MAIITSFKKHTPDRITAQHTTAEARYFVFEDAHGDKHFQLNTYGSKDRQVVGSQSQNIRLSENLAKELISILTAAFPCE